MKIELMLLACFVLSAIFSCSGKRPMSLGVNNGKLKTCPESPNCVSSQSEDKAHYIAPISYTGSVDKARNTLLSVIKKIKRTNIILVKEDYIYTEFKSAIFRFVDDVEFYFPKNEKIIHVRSASRIGYSDMGVNRKRIENIRELFTLQ